MESMFREKRRGRNGGGIYGGDVESSEAQEGASEYTICAYWRKFEATTYPAQQRPSWQLRDLIVARQAFCVASPATICTANVVSLLLSLKMR